MARKKILLIEDELILAKEIESRLARRGYDTVGIATDGEQALELVKTNPPDLALTDIKLSGKLDGIEVAEILQVRHQIPVVFLTAYTDEEVLRRAKVIKPYGYIIKPVQDEELHTNIQLALYRHEMGAHIRTNEHRFRSLIEYSGVLFLIVDAEYAIQYVSNTSISLLGIEPGELTGQSILTLIDEHHHKDVMLFLDDVIKTPRKYCCIEIPLLAEIDGAHTFQLTANNQLEDPLVSGIIINAHNITEQKKVENKYLLKSRQQEKVLAVARDINSSLDLQNVLEHITTQAKELLNSISCVIYQLGKDKSTLIPLVAVDPEFENEIMQTPIKVESSFSGQAIITGECQIFNDALANPHGAQIPGTPDNEEECVIVAPLFLDKRPAGVICVSRIGEAYTADEVEVADMFANFASIALGNASAYESLHREMQEHKVTMSKLTTLKRNLEIRVAERTAELRRSKEILQQERDLFIDGPVATIRWEKEEGEEAKVIYVSPNISNFGINKEKLVSGETNLYTLLHPEDHQIVKDNSQRYLQDDSLYWEQEYRLLIPGRDMIWIYEFLRRIPNDTTKKTAIYHSYLIDISDLKRTQAELQEKQLQLAHSGRLAMLGEMATGVAHEINQPLAIIRAQSELLKIILVKVPNLESTIISDLNTVIEQVDRAANIIDHVRNFARIDEEVTGPVSLVEPLEDSLVFFSRQFLNHNIKFTMDCTHDLPLAMVHPQRFEQIIVNLLSNSRHAVDLQGDTLGKEFEKQIDISLKPISTSLIQLVISDNGVGMTADQLDNCQRPFFTTKQKGDGTGLGLSIVRSLVKEFNGILEIDSASGKGTTVTVSIPISQP